MIHTHWGIFSHLKKEIKKYTFFISFPSFLGAFSHFGEAGAVNWYHMCSTLFHQFSFVPLT